MGKKILRVTCVVLMSIMFAAGLTLLAKSHNSHQEVQAAIITGTDGSGSGMANDPYLIGSRDKFIEFAPEFALQGTVANPRYFVIINDIDMAGFIHPNSTLANHVILDGQNFTLSNLSSHLFNTVSGPNSVIKNLNFSGDPIFGSGNIAYEFSGTMDNVHNIEGNVLFTTSVGGLVNYSEDATFRYCSNSARIRRSPGGNTLDVNGGIIGWARGNLYIINSFNTGDVVTMGTAESSGGLVGKITNTGADVATVELSYNEGFINGNRSAGLVGKKEGTGKLVIRESYNKGIITNRSSSPEAAGVLAWADNNGQIEILSCYNTGNVSNTQSSSNAGPAGIFSRNSGASVIILNNYNTGTVRNAIYNAAMTGIAAQHNFARTGSNSITALGAGVSTKADADMKLASFVTDINRESPIQNAFKRDDTSPLLNNGYPVLVGLTTVNFIFNPNGGTIDGNSEPIRLDRLQVTPTAINPELIKRVGYKFRGWNTNAQATVTVSGTLPDGTFENHIDVLSVVPLRSATYYAVWEATPYTINVIHSTNIQGTQDYSVHSVASDGSDQIMSDRRITVGHNIFLQTWVDVAGDNYFVEWRIKNGLGSEDWEIFHGGVRPLLAPTIQIGSSTGFLPEQLQLYVNGESIIDESFLGKYAFDGVITFEARYMRGTPLRLSVDTVSGGRNWGTLMLNDAATNFPRNLTLAAEDTIKISVRPNNFYKFQGFNTRTLGSTGAFLPVAAGVIQFDDVSKYYSFSVSNVAENIEVQVVFVPIEYRITVKAETVAGEPINTPEIITDTGAPEKVSLGGTLNRIQLNSVGEYRLIHATRDNIKIKNPYTGEYAYRTANSGQINLPINTQFLTNFWHENWDPEDTSKSIEIVAIFIKLVSLDVSVNDSEFGRISVSVRGLTPQDVPNVASFSGALAVGSTVTVHLLPMHDTRLVLIVDELNPLNPIFDASATSEAPPRTITFPLAQQRDILVVFEKLAYTFELVVVDNNRNTSIDLPTSPSVMIGSVPAGWEIDGLGLDDVISITKGVFDNNEWRFVGWYILFGDNQEEYRGGNPGDNYDLTQGHAIMIDDDFIEKYLSDSVHILIEARFAKTFSVNIGLVHEGSGSIEGEGVQLGSTRHDAATPLEIFLTPKKHYRLAGIDGLKDGEFIDFGKLSVIIYATEMRDLKINFVPIQNSIESNNKLPNKGKIEVRSTYRGVLGIGDRVTLQYTPRVGFQRTSWSINGISVDDIRTQYPGSGARVSGNTVSFTITWDWFNDWINDDIISLDSYVKVKINTFLILGIVAAAIIVPVLGLGIVFLILANKRRKAEYALALQKMKVAKARLGHADMLRNLKEGE